MGYQDFLLELALAHGIPDVETLLSAHGAEYAFQIRSRDRARLVVDELRNSIDIDFSSAKVLDVGCAYGSFAVEFAKLGCQVVGIDINEKWLKLAEANARDEVKCGFLKCDASTRTARKMLLEAGPFDLVILNDVFEHIYDTAGLLENLRIVMKPGAILYYKTPNGRASRNVISEGHKKKFALSLLPPDYWQMFVTAPFHIYYRRESHFKALLQYFNFHHLKDLAVNNDLSHDQTRRHIKSDLSKIKRMLRKENFETPNQYKAMREFVKYYLDEVSSDLETMDWDSLFRNYRVTFWTAIARS